MRTKPTNGRIIRDPGSAERINQACDSSPNCPPPHGRLTWLAEQFNKRGNGKTITVETCRKWLGGEAAPRKDKIGLLASILGVDPTWLQTGVYGRDSGSVSSKNTDDRVTPVRDNMTFRGDTIQIAIRPNVSVYVTDIPLDLTRVEAQKIANIILAHAVSEEA